MVLVVTQVAHAQGEMRRPGLWGSYSSRRMTMPYNSLGLLLGPLQTPLFGQRYGDNAPEGGLSYESNAATEDGTVDQLWLRGGVVFGLSPQLEAGALFLTFRMVPDFAYSNFPVFITYSWTLNCVDIAARFSFLTPVETKEWSFNPGMPLAVRLDQARIDTGVFVPLLTDDGASIGLNVPLRATFNLSPRWFVGVESGFYEAAFGKGPGASSSLGGSVGYTTFVGPRLIDFAVRLYWDDLVRYSPNSGESALDAASYQLVAGATFHAKVM
jgi:hypothetical protein